jgi:hypothetical protein
MTRVNLEKYAATAAMVEKIMKPLRRDVMSSRPKKGEKIVRVKPLQKKYAIHFNGNI